MKKTLKTIVCASVIALMACAAISPNIIAASNTSLKVGSENIYISAGTKATADGTATFSASTKTLTLNGYKGDAITTDLTNLKINIAKDSSITSLISSGNISLSGTKALTIEKNISVTGNFNIGSLCTSPKAEIIKVSGNNVLSTDGSTAATSPITISSTSCSSNTPNTSATAENPDTLDPIYIYLIIFAVSSAALIIGRHFAKR